MRGESDIKEFIMGNLTVHDCWVGRNRLTLDSSCDDDLDITVTALFDRVISNNARLHPELLSHDAAMNRFQQNGLDQVPHVIALLLGVCMRNCQCYKDLAFSEDCIPAMSNFCDRGGAQRKWEAKRDNRSSAAAVVVQQVHLRSTAAESALETEFNFATTG